MFRRCWRLTTVLISKRGRAHGGGDGCGLCGMVSPPGRVRFIPLHPGRCHAVRGFRTSLHVFAVRGFCGGGRIGGVDESAGDAPHSRSWVSPGLGRVRKARVRGTGGQYGGEAEMAGRRQVSGLGLARQTAAQRTRGTRERRPVVAGPTTLGVGIASNSTAVLGAGTRWPSSHEEGPRTGPPTRRCWCARRRAREPWTRRM